MKVVGRKQEIDLLVRAIQLNRNILIEGPVGVGKTFLVQSVLQSMKKKFERVDGDTRYTEQKMTGWFDPPLVLKKGYVATSFIEGPLTSAMRSGIPLFVNELNRMPEAVQNVLLPAMDERRITLPKIGEKVAKPGFLVIATQNPKEFTATHALSEALIDRFEMIRLNYQSREEELQIISGIVGTKVKPAMLSRIVDLVRATRVHSSVKRGASLRAAIAVAELVAGGMDLEQGSLMALPSRIELVSNEEDAAEFIKNLLTTAELPLTPEKKKIGMSV